jgi:hypothetical protein
MPANSTNTLLNQIPNPEEVRERLAENLREADALRSLLRAAEKIEKSRQRPGEAANAR